MLLIMSLSSCSTWGTTTIYKPGANQSRSPERDRSGSVNISLLFLVKVFTTQPPTSSVPCGKSANAVMWNGLCLDCVTYTNDNSRAWKCESVNTYASVHTWHTVTYQTLEGGWGRVTCLVCTRQDGGDSHPPRFQLMTQCVDEEVESCFRCSVRCQAGKWLVTWKQTYNVTYRLTITSIMAECVAETPKKTHSASQGSDEQNCVTQADCGTHKFVQESAQDLVKSSNRQNCLLLLCFTPATDIKLLRKGIFLRDL